MAIPPTPREIVADPAPYADQPALIQIAWCELKKARGQAVRYDRLGEPAHLIDRTGVVGDAGDAMAHRALRIRDAIARAADRGAPTRPAALILGEVTR